MSDPRYPQCSPPGRQPYPQDPRSWQDENRYAPGSVPRSMPAAMAQPRPQPYAPYPNQGPGPAYAMNSSQPRPSHTALPGPRRPGPGPNSQYRSGHAQTPSRSNTTGPSPQYQQQYARGPSRSSTMDSSASSTRVQWVVDRVPHYRLTLEAVDEYLRRKFPRNEYGSSDFQVQFMSDAIVFRVPRKLTQQEKDVEVRALKRREPNDDYDY